MEKFTPQQALDYIYASGHTQGLPSRYEAQAMLPDINAHFKIGIRQSSVRVINGQKVTAFITPKYVSIEDMLAYLRNRQAGVSAEEAQVMAVEEDNEPNPILRILRHAVFHVNPSATGTLEQAIIKAINHCISSRTLEPSKEKLIVHIAGTSDDMTYGFVIKERPKAEAFTIPFCIQRNANTMGSAAVTYTGHLLTPLQLNNVASIGQCLTEVIRYVKE
ncbi:MAG: hypothetical protein J6T76_02715 [Paludibacteraceae bacterium]|nr:hypothetical protein [Paludibacteraceae bacterium]MBO7455296.1 hypothetical protein [Paludibacteraceae bacterium]